MNVESLARESSGRANVNAECQFLFVLQDYYTVPIRPSRPGSGLMVSLALWNIGLQE